MKKINFLPTKFKYNSETKCIEMFYRTKNSHKLNRTEIPFDHYIFISPDYRRYGNVDEMYMLLTTNAPLIKVYMDPYDAYNLYSTTRYITGEADISPEQRFVCDTFYDVEFPSYIKPRIFFLDIETWVKDGKVPSFNHNVSDINAITIFDSYTEVYYSWFLVPNNNSEDLCTLENQIIAETSEYGKVVVKLFTTPKALLSSFMKFIKLNCPDIITAWNSKFDIPYITRKIYDYFGIEGLKSISPFNRYSTKIKYALETGSDINVDTLIPGIDVIDLMALYKKNSETEKPSYALNIIAEEELGETKLIEEGDNNDPSYMYTNNFINFCKYNIQDVRLLTLLENKLMLINLAVTIRNIVKTNFQDIFFETITIDNMFIMEAVRRRNNGWNYVLPSKPKHINKEKYLGAYVKAPIRGLFKWVADGDFSSLYPSIVKTFNLSNETLVCTVDNYQWIVLYLIAKEFKLTDLKYAFDEILPKYLEYDLDLVEKIDSLNNVNFKELGNNLIINTKYFKLYEDLNHPETFNSLSEFVNWLKKNNYCFLPNGIVVDQNKSNAIISKVISDIMDSRKKYKKIMLDYLEQGNIAMYNVYDTYQTAVKLINNAVYGVTANEKFRLFNIKISEGITTTGQLLIRSCTHVVNKYLNELANTKDKDFVITNDTDSIIFTLQNIVNHPTSTKDSEILKEISEYSRICIDHVNTSIYSMCKNMFYKTNANKSNTFLSLKNEWLANSGIFIAKKCYAIHIVFKEGIPYEKLIPKGISLKRSSTPKALKPFLENVLNNILDFKSKEEIDKILIEECNKLKNVYKLKDIALPISVNDIESYKNLPIHIRGAKIWNSHFAQSDFDKINTGKVKYIYIKRWKDNLKLNMDGEYVISVPDQDKYWMYIEDKIEVDYDKMLDRLILKPVSAFYSALNWKLPNAVTSNNTGVFNTFMNTKSSLKIKLI